jgi:hypothetical protein
MSWNSITNIKLESSENSRFIDDVVRIISSQLQSIGTSNPFEYFNQNLGSDIVTQGLLFADNWLRGNSSRTNENLTNAVIVGVNWILQNTTLTPPPQQGGPNGGNMLSAMPREGLLAFYSLQNILSLEVHRNFIQTLNQQLVPRFEQLGLTGARFQEFQSSFTPSLYSQGYITANNWLISNLPLTNDKVPLAIDESINFIRNNTPLLDNTAQPPPPPPQPPPPQPPPPQAPTAAQMTILQEVANRIPELRSGNGPPFDTSLLDQWRTDFTTYMMRNPNFTVDQMESFVRNWITSNGGTLAPRSPDLPPLDTAQPLDTVQPLDTAPSLESFTNKAKKIYQDFTSRFSLMPTEYAPAL